MKVDFEKVGIISSYFADNIEGLYVTKLLKLFYYLDFCIIQSERFFSNKRCLLQVAVWSCSNSDKE